jgi:hypothetical protein
MPADFRESIHILLFLCRLTASDAHSERHSFPIRVELAFTGTYSVTTGLKRALVLPTTVNRICRTRDLQQYKSLVEFANDTGPGSLVEIRFPPETRLYTLRHASPRKCIVIDMFGRFYPVCGCSG